jgi:hypothetical protein
VVTADVPWVDSVPDELDSPEDPALAEDELAEDSELVVGVLEVVAVGVVVVPFFADSAGSCPEASCT